MPVITPRLTGHNARNAPKGHSHEEGNDAADALAGYAQKGGAMNEQDIDQVMDGLRADDD